jgi:hypothetical protein
MKKNKKHFLFLVILIASCSFRTKEDNDIQENIFVINRILNGVWVREDYINSLRVNKSPSKASEFLKEEVSLIFDTASLNIDTLEIGVSFNNHEGGNYFLPIKDFKGNKARIYAPEQTKSNKEIEFSITEKDTFLFLTKFSKTGKIISKTKFVRVLSNVELINNDLGFGIEYITNVLVIEGEYLLIDSLDNIISRNINFNKVGSISGWEGINRYNLLTDFVEFEEKMKDDIIILSGNRNVQKKNEFKYQFINDTIMIYTRSNQSNKNLVYKLVKIEK